MQACNLPVPLHSRSFTSDRDQSLRTMLPQQQHPKAAQHESTTDSFIPWSGVDPCLQVKDRMSCNFMKLISAQLCLPPDLGKHHHPDQNLY